MPSFRKTYSDIFRRFGCPLTERVAVAERAIAAAEKRLGVAVPAALRGYYLVAGREQRFNTSFQRMLPVSEWSVDDGRLIFMEENQAVVFWGVDVRSRRSADPPVFQGVNDEPIAWYPESPRCSEFLSVILQLQAVSGGMPHCATAPAPTKSSYRFEREGWIYYGEVNSLKAYGRPNQVVCLMPPGFPYDDVWAVLVGAKTKRELHAIGAELGVEFDIR